MICDVLRKDIISELNKNWKEYEEHCQKNGTRPYYEDYRKWLNEKASQNILA